MPQINKTFTLDITPERFLENCSVEELIETQLLLSSSRYQNMISKAELDADELIKANFTPPHLNNGLPQKSNPETVTL